MEGKSLYTPALRGCVAALAAVVFFSAMARGAHDVWAATLADLSILSLGIAVLWIRGRAAASQGLVVSGYVPAILLMSALALSCVFSVHPGESFVALLDWFSALAAFYIALNIFQSDEAIQEFLALIGLAVWIELAVNVFQRFCAGNILAPPIGTLANADIAAAFLLVWIAPFYGLSLKPRSFYLRATAAAAAVGVVLFASKWAVLCLIAAAPFFVGLDNVQRAIARWRRRVWIVVAAIAAAFVLFIRLHDWSSAKLSVTTRLLWWASGLRMFRDHLWLGIGLGNYPSAYLSYKVGSGLNTLYAHSFIVEILSETGLIGFAAVFFFLSWWLSRARKPGTRRWFILGAGIMFSYVAINVAMEYWLNLAIFWIFLGIAIAPAVADDARWRPRGAALIILTALAIGSVPYLAAPFVASRDCVAGSQYLGRRDFDGAARAFSAAADAYPISSQAQQGLARTRVLESISTKNAALMAEAIAHQKKAIALNRRDGELYIQLGDYLRAASLNFPAAFPGQIPDADAKMAQPAARGASGRNHER